MMLRAGYRRRRGTLLWGLSLGRRSASVAWGLILIVLGVVLWMEQQDLIPRGYWRHGWPWLIIIMSAIQLVTAHSAHRLGDAVTFGLIGVWCLLVTSHWHGLTWINSWPLSLVAVGVGMLSRVVAGMFLDDSRDRLEPEDPGRKESPHA